RRLSTPASCGRVRWNGCRSRHRGASGDAPWWPCLGRRQGERGGDLFVCAARGRDEVRGPDAIDILLVEDSDADAELTVRALRKSRLESRLVRVRDGVAALDFIYRRGDYEERGGGQPRVILLDIKMPRLDGIDVLRSLKSDDETRTIPVVMLTSSRE